MRIETTTDNQRIVGLLVPNAAVETVLQGSFSPLSLSKNMQCGYVFMICLHICEIEIFECAKRLYSPNFSN